MVHEEKADCDVRLFLLSLPINRIAFKDGSFSIHYSTYPMSNDNLTEMTSTTTSQVMSSLLPLKTTDFTFTSWIISP
ncbi:hypothetical protein BH18THE2_BH18THE2_34460 [soil metagenome]